MTTAPLYIEQTTPCPAPGTGWPAQPLSERDENRLLILNSMTWLLEADLNAIRNYDPSRNLSLEQIILDDRGFRLDIRGKNPDRVGLPSHSRLVVDAGEQKGVFKRSDPQRERRLDWGSICWRKAAYRILLRAKSSSLPRPGGRLLRPPLCRHRNRTALRENIYL